MAATVVAPVTEGPKRIVSLSTLSSQMLNQLGLGNRVVGRTGDDATTLPNHLNGGPAEQVGTMAAPDVSAIERLKPDLVAGVVGPGTDDAFIFAKSQGIAFVAIRTDGLADIARAWQTLGVAVGQPEAGQSRSADFIAACDAAVVHTPPDPGPEVVIVHQHTPLLVAGPGGYGHDLITGNGAVNAGQGAGVPLAHWPDALLFAAAPATVLDFSPQRHDPQAKQAFAARFAELEAVRAGRFFAAPRAVFAPDLDAAADVAWVNQALYGTLARQDNAPVQPAGEPR
jgi:ABC-type Fe3+-hydroxamate transport system substrate-binding protein